MSTLVQTVLKYSFENSRLLEDALKSAHRSDQDGTSYDGNRGLAHYGILAIQIAETHDRIVEKKDTLHDFNVHEHWSRTKKGRAKACSSLGIEDCINQSVRQGNQRPSDTVLDNALSAILGAIWLDCEGQERTTATTRRTIWAVIRSIDAAVSGQPSPVAGEIDLLPTLPTTPDAILIQPRTKTGEADLGLEQEQDPMQDFAKGWFDQIGDRQDISNFYTSFIPEPETNITEVEGTLSCGDLVYENPIQRASPPSTNCRTLGAVSNFQFQDVPTQGTRQNIALEDVSAAEVRNADTDPEVLTTGAKRKRRKREKEKADSTYRDMLNSERRKLTRVLEVEGERLKRFLEYPGLGECGGKTSNVLRFIWLAIGSWQTISNFRDQLQLARSSPYVYDRSNTLTWSAVEIYHEICRLDTEEYLTVLLRRYHAVKLCMDEPMDGGLHGYIMVETPSTILAGGRSTPGNPGMIRKAVRTDEIVSKIMPNIERNSTEFEKVRKRVKQLQKLAMYLGVLINIYGLGILALLPSGVSFGELSLTDRMLTAIDEPTFRDFTSCLHREQGLLLESLSRALEPAVQALLTYTLNSTPEYFVERIDLSILSNQPKGLLHLIYNQLLRGQTV